jgi:hypothetical protein
MQITEVMPGQPAPSLMPRRRIMADHITYIGLDVHKEAIVVGAVIGGAPPVCLQLRNNCRSAESITQCQIRT